MFINIAGKNGMNGVVVWEENQKYVVVFSRPLHNLKFSQFTSFLGRGRQRNVLKCRGRAKPCRACRAVVFVH